MQAALAMVSGSLVGFSLGLIGGGGSILAVPLLLYLVGVPDPHVAIGTSSLAVSVNALTNLLPHARAGHVRWAAATLFAGVGASGAMLGSSLGKSLDGGRLLALFAVLMIVIALLMQRRGQVAPTAGGPVSGAMAARIAGTGLGVGMLSGFFGIGGGFLIVPGLVFSAGLPIIDAIGSSLVGVAAFGLTTALNYAASGLVAWPIGLEYIAGGVAGGWLGARLARHLALQDRMLLNRLFGGVLLAVALYMLARSAAVLG